MDDQFSGRTDDDLFYDDFEPVDGKVIIMPDIPLELAASFNKKNTTAIIPTSDPISLKSEPTRDSATMMESPQIHSTAPAVAPKPSAPRRGLANSRFAPKPGEEDESPFKPSLPASPPKSAKKNPRSKGEKAAKPKDVASPPPKQATPASPTQKNAAPASPGRKNGANQKNSTQAPKQKHLSPSPTGRDRSADKNKPNRQSGRRDKSPASHGGQGPRQSRKPAESARTQSGANPRTKMSEAELTAKMDQMRLRSAEATKKFEAAENDKTQHAAAVAKHNEELQRRRKAEEERKKAQDSERQRNREKKLKAMKDHDGAWDQAKFSRESGAPSPRTFGRGGRNDRGPRRDEDSHERTAAMDGNGPHNSLPELRSDGAKGGKSAGRNRRNGRNKNSPPAPLARIVVEEVASAPVSASLTPNTVNEPVTPKPLTPLPSFDIGNWGDEVEEFEAQQQAAGRL